MLEPWPNFGQIFSGLWVGRYIGTGEVLLIYRCEVSVEAQVQNVRYAIVGEEVNWLEENFLLRVHECVKKLWKVK